MDVDEIEDILKVIVTTEDTDLESLQTPGLHVQDSDGRGDDEDDDEKEDDEEQLKESEDLADFLEGGSRDTAPAISSWQAQQVIIKTKNRT